MMGVYYDWDAEEEAEKEYNDWFRRRVLEEIKHETDTDSDGHSLFSCRGLR